MSGSEQLAVYLRIATVVVPVAVYFLLLGLLNSRRHPQLLTGRGDFALLMAAMGLVVVFGVVNYFETPLPITLLIAAGVTAGVLLARPRSRTWVIYNIPPDVARRMIRRVLERTGLEVVEQEGGFAIADSDEKVEISGFSLLRNVTVRLRNAGEQLEKSFAAELSWALASIEAETTPMAASLLLVATGMIVAPLALMAQQAPEIVRLLTDLLNY